jgi:hypothetical protein
MSGLLTKLSSESDKNNIRVYFTADNYFGNGRAVSTAGSGQRFPICFP